MEKIDFSALAQILINRSRELLPRWLPGGVLRGNEYQCGSIRGEEGQSLKINIVSGKWADFAGDQRGGDLISLYAAIKDIKQIEAANILNDEVGITVYKKKLSKSVSANPDLLPPPPGSDMPSMVHKRLGKASNFWEYTDASGATLFYVSRHDNEAANKKEFLPWSFSRTGRWINRMWPKPRPLYNQQDMAENPTMPVCVVEGEKAADAARVILNGKYVVTTWPSGSSNWAYADWSILSGRRVLIWPDADEPGSKAANGIAEVLVDICKEVKILNVQKTHAHGWDADDALKEGMNYGSFAAWGKEIVYIYKKVGIVAREENNENDATYNVDITVSGESHNATLSQYQRWEAAGLVMSNAKTPKPLQTADNICRLLENDHLFKDKIWFDEFHQKVFSRVFSDEPRELIDGDVFRIYRLLQGELGMGTISIGSLRAAIGSMAYSYGNVRNEPREWLESLKWDEKQRLRVFMRDYMGCTSEPDEYLRAIGENLFGGMVARVMSPGCKADNMVVFEGKQGAGKSTALNVIGGKWYTETAEDPKNKDFYLAIQGAMIVEIAELDSFSRAEINTIKKTMTCRVDRFRAPYAANMSDSPRQCLFVGTTNQHDYLRDSSGGRRFWPVTTGKIDIKKIEEDREQLFAEAVFRLSMGFPYWEVPINIAESEQESRYNADAWEPKISKWIEDKSRFFLIDLACDCLGFSVSQIRKNDSNRIGEILRRLGCVSRTVRVTGDPSKIVRCWINEHVDGIDLTAKNDLYKTLLVRNSAKSLNGGHVTDT